MKQHDSTRMQTKAIVLFNDECGVCRRIAHWVEKSAQRKSGETSIVLRPIGDDPDALRALNPNLDIWDAYATIHVLMPDGSMKLGGEAVAETLRNLPNCRWFTWTFTANIFGFRPFQMALNLAYKILADARPLFGCESCGTPGIWLRPIHWVVQRAKGLSKQSRPRNSTPHLTPLLARAHLAPSPGERSERSPRE